MEDLSAIIKVLGEENTTRLKSAITDLIIGQCEADLESMNNYILNPDDVSELVEEVNKEVKEEIKSLIKEKLIAKALKELDKLDI